jgi:uncharacterized protein (DUF4415 family)
MNAKEQVMSKHPKSLIDDDGEVGELGSEFFAEAKRGRPAMPKDEIKQRVTMFLDRDIIEHFKRGGRGWQTRVNAALRELTKH